jgi:acetolactate synthase I/II/III large subunit
MSETSLTGAEAIVSTLADCGVTACFANPGTSEMHLVTALDREPRIRPVLCLFEGVASGAADGFARLAGTPALTLLHLGPGYANAAANIHNARRAHTPMVNLIGDHAVSHRTLDAPLASDIASLARPNSVWMGTAETLDQAGEAAAEAYAQSFGPPPGPVSLIVPADIAWTRGARRASPRAGRALAETPGGDVDAAGRALKSAARPTLLVGGSGLSVKGLAACARLEAAGVRIVSETFAARQARGASVLAPDRLPYFAEMAVEFLQGTDLLLLAGTKAPVAFFAYPGKPGRLTPEGTATIDLGGPGVDAAATLSDLADAIGAPVVAPLLRNSSGAGAPGDKFTAHAVGSVLARHIVEGTAIADDGVTAGLPVFLATANAPPHDWMGLTGGAIGLGLPMAVGAAVARPDSKIVCLSGDGAGMYTIQALWTMARESLNVVTLVFVNNAYRILRIELARTDAGKAGKAADALLSLDRPEIDWVSVSHGLGVPATRVSDVAGLDAALARAFAEKGPRLIAVQVTG